MQYSFCNGNFPLISSKDQSKDKQVNYSVFYLVGGRSLIKSNLAKLILIIMLSCSVQIWIMQDLISLRPQSTSWKSLTAV